MDNTHVFASNNNHVTQQICNTMHWLHETTESVVHNQNHTHNIKIYRSKHLKIANVKTTIAKNKKQLYYNAITKIKKQYNTTNNINIKTKKPRKFKITKNNDRYVNNYEDKTNKK